MKISRDELPFTYRPDLLVDQLINRLGVRTCSGLARRLAVSPSMISKVRNARSPVTAELLLLMHDASGIPIRELRLMMGDTRQRFEPIRMPEADSLSFDAAATRKSATQPAANHAEATQATGNYAATRHESTADAARR